jgi:hypothetical protein
MTTTQIKQAGAATHTTGATCSVTNASAAVVSTAPDFGPTDIGRTITSVSTSGKKVASIADAYHMTMDGNATASTGPQTVAMAAALVNVTKKTGGYTDKTSTYLTTLPPGASHLAQHALNQWTNCGGAAGTTATRVAKVLAAQGLVVQET